MRPCGGNDMLSMHEIVSIESADKATPAAALAARITALFSKLFYLIPIGIIGNILYSLLSADPAMMRSVVQFSPVYLVLALLLSVVPWFTGSLRLFIWARFLGKCVSYRDMFKIVISAELGAAVSPPIVAGGPVKVSDADATGVFRKQGAVPDRTGRF